MTKNVSIDLKRRNNRIGFALRLSCFGNTYFV